MDCVSIVFKFAYINWHCRAVLVDKMIITVGVVGAIILNQSYYLQNFHLIDYNMLVFTIIILARRLIAAIVKEVRILFLVSAFSELGFYP